MSQGFDLTQYAGKTATRYVYEIENYPNATDPVYATLLVYQDQVIGAEDVLQPKGYGQVDAALLAPPFYSGGSGYDRPRQAA